jgi:hypothetical protein
MAKVREARHYQHPKAPVRRIATAAAFQARASMKVALKALRDELDLEKVKTLIRHGRHRDIAHTAIDWHHFEQVLRHPFERLARAYEAGAELGQRKINGAFAARRRGVRYVRKGGPGAVSEEPSGRWTTRLLEIEVPEADSAVTEALAILKRQSSVAKWTDRPGGKFDKAAVDYSLGKPHAHCGLCAHYGSYAKAFNPDQPRDEHGQWTAGGAMLTSTGVPMSQYTHESLKEDFREQSGERDPETVDVPISSIRATQATVGAGEGRSEGAPVPGMRDEHGYVHIINGHHRVHAAIQRGDTTIRARVFNIRSAVRKEAGGGLCELVEGEVEPQMWCELFAPAVAKGIHQDQPQRDISIPMSGYTEAGLKAAWEAAMADRKPRLVDAPVDMLRATQAKVNIREGVSDEPINGIIDAAGLIHIVDGHHRSDDAKRSGKAAISARVFGLDLRKHFFGDNYEFDHEREAEETVRSLSKGSPDQPRPLKKSLVQLFEKAVTDAFTFDRFDDATQQWLREQQDELIAELEDSVRDTIEQVIASGVRDGLSAEDMAADIRDTIGLTDRQAQAVMNYRSMLEDLDPDALDRQLRAAGFDEMLQDAIDNDIPLDEAAVNTMVDAYESNYLDYRADTIAQTESVRMANAGLQDAYEQAIDRGALPAEAVRQYWQIALDEKTCPICESIPDNNPDGVAMGEDFDSDDGPQDQPPVHPSCRCSIEIVTDLDQVPDEEAA